MPGENTGGDGWRRKCPVAGRRAPPALASAPPSPPTVASLLSLPPELLTYILALTCPTDSPIHTAQARSLALTHRSLTPLAQQLLYSDVTLHDKPHIQAFIDSPIFGEYAGYIRRLRFFPRGEESDGGWRGGIGADEKVDGWAVERLLEALRGSWKRRVTGGGGSMGIEVLDIAAVEHLRFDILEGEWLASLRDLTLGPSIIPPGSIAPFPPPFSFRLTSLTLHNNHWQSLPAALLKVFLVPSFPLLPDETEGKLHHLDLSATYDVSPFDAFLAHFYPPHFGGEPITPLSALRTLRLPPFETAAHLSFASSALALLDPHKIAYVELPPLSSATSGQYDVLWAELGGLFRPEPGGEEGGGAAGGLAEVGLRGWPTTALVETAKAVLAAAGMDTMPPVLFPSSSTGRKSGLRRLSFRRLLAVEEFGKVLGGPELLEQAEAYGVEVVCGERVDEE
ncbi:hypothetical protein JCM8097_009294 [Rhodosporidiobolus ruineniae]